MNRSALHCTLYLIAALVLSPARAETQKAPAWSLKTPEGATVNFPADAHGQPSVLLFWPSWCPYSRALQPYVQDIWNDYRGVGVNVWTINILEKGDPVQVMKDRGLTFPLLLNGDALRESYGIVRTPWLVVVDGDDQIIYTRPPNPTTPIDTAKDVRNALNGLLGPKAVPLPTSYPAPYDLHLRSAADQPDRRAPTPIPPAEANAWVEQYLSTIGPDERISEFPASGSLGKGSDAIGEARKVWTTRFGADHVAAQAPYRAYRRNNRWIVLGDGLNQKLGQGLVAVLDAETGAVVRVADHP